MAPHPDAPAPKAGRWTRVKAIFQDAADLPAAARDAFVAQACAGDLDLQQSVVALLAQLEATGTVDLLPPIAPRHSLAPGATLNGRFRILRFAGAGGMGEVYEAEDLELGGTIALKTLRPSLLEDEHFLGRFRREVQLARQVTHPNICRIFDVGNDNGRAYLTMEFLDGETLGAYLRRHGRLTSEAALPLVRQIADGLTALHTQGIVHRDLKPGNILVCNSSSGGPRAVITDFGLARAAAGTGDSTASMSGRLMGTPDYMAPEQLRGESVTPASDLYALGLILYEMVTGKKAYPGGQALENAVQRMMEPPTPPRQQSADVTADWEAVILRCLERDPLHRPASAQEVVAGLSGDLPPLRKPVPRRTWFLWAAGIFLALLAAFFVGSRVGGRSNSTASSDQRVALLPLTVLSKEPELRVFALGLMDTVTSRLSQFDSPGARQLLVVPASEVRAQQAATASDAATKFGATTAVEGTLQSEGDRVQLLLTLIDTEKKVQLETIRLNQPRGDVIGLQDAAVTRLANALNVTIQPRYAKEQQQMSSLAPGALEFYLQGRGYLQRPDQLQSIDNAITVFQRALNTDAGYALAYSGLGEAYLYKRDLTQDTKWMAPALENARKGLALNPSDPQTHIVMGRVNRGTGRYEESQRDFEEALRLDGRSNEAYVGLANAYFELKQYDKAEATYQKAISLRPGDWMSYRQLGLFYYRRRDLEKAIAQFQQVVNLNPDNAQGYVNIGAFQGMQGKLDDAEKTWLKALELDPQRVSTITNLAQVYLQRQQYAKAISMYERAQPAKQKSHILWGSLGLAYLGAGDRLKGQNALTQALALLDKELLIDPNNGVAFGFLAFWRASAGRRDFEQPLRRSLALAPNHLENSIRAAETWMTGGQRDRAIAQAQDAVSRGYSLDSVKRSTQLKEIVALLKPATTEHK